MQLYKKEKTFLAYFLPLMSVKLLNITAENIILQAVAVACFFVFIAYFLKVQIPKKIYSLYAILGLYSLLLLFTCGKQGVFFSVLMIILMRDIDLNRNVYKYCFCVGVIFVLLSCILERNTGDYTLRYINGEWREMFKRSNILFISFLAVMYLYLLQRNDKMKWTIALPLIIISYVMSIYTGSRTGVAVVALFFFLVFSLQIDFIKNSKLVKSLCCISPIICMGLIFSATSFYGKSDIVDVLDIITQGRIYQSSVFLDKYGISIFGQHIIENFDSSAGEFACLDSAYMDMLICEGLIFSVFWIIVTMKVINFMWNQNRFLEVAILVSYAVYGITETFLINCFLNISIFFYGEYMYNKFGVCPMAKH